MIEAHEDQAAGLRRLFRCAPPTVVALYAAGRGRATIAVQAAYRFAGRANRVLILDEAAGDAALAAPLGVAPGVDLLSVLSGRTRPQELLQPVPGLVGRVPVAAAALALPLLDHERRGVLIDALGELHRRAGFVLIHASGEGAADPSPLIFATPRHLVVAEATRSGATEAYRIIKHLARAGAGALHVAVSGARDRAEAQAFFDALARLVTQHVGVPLTWLGEMEHDDLAEALTGKSVPRYSRDAERAFLRRLSMMASSPGGGTAFASDRAQGGRKAM